MSITYPTIRRLYRENFKGEIPFTLPSTKQAKFIKEYKEKILSITGIRESRYHYSYREHKEDHEFTFECEGEDFKIAFRHNNLTIKENYKDRHPIYEPKQLLRFIAELKEFVVQRTARQQKTKKIINLKKQAIKAKIKALSKEENFDYYYNEYYTNKIKLFIKIGKTQTLELDIPFGKFQSILQELKDFIKMAKRLAKIGIIFSIKRNQTMWS